MKKMMLRHTKNFTLEKPQPHNVYNRSFTPTSDRTTRLALCRNVFATLAQNDKGGRTRRAIVVLAILYSVVTVKVKKT